MKNVEMILKNLIGKGFDPEDIITELNLDENVIINKVEGYTSNFDGYGQCELWELEIEDTEEYYKIFVDSNYIIAEVQ